MRKLLLAAFAAIALFCPLPAHAQDATPRGSSTMTPDVVGLATTVNAQCTTPTSGCSAGQFASIRVGGRSSIGAQVVTSNFTGTLRPYASQDGGATWILVRMRQGYGSTASNSASVNSAAYAGSTTTENWTIILPFGAATDVMVASTAAVTNSVTVQMLASAAPTNPLADAVSTKGTQAPAGLQTQDIKDSGRTFVVLGADGVTPAIAETVITFSQNKAGTVTGSATTYAITAAKTLRLQSLACSFTAGATANRVRVALRLNTGGACVAGSGLLMPAMELAPNYGTATAAEGGIFGEVPFPDGLELSGSSWNICLTESATAAAGTLTCALTGYEY